ncbi:MAG: nucleotide pyrophosphatase, partial [Nevskiales bacterium]
PTLLHSLGLPTPSDFEGKVAATFFEESWLAQHPITIGAPTQRGGEREKSEEMDDNEKKQIIEQLQMLGYME